MSTSVRILIVDDDVELANLMKDFLIQYEFDVQTEPRGDTGITRIVQENPDLVILDLMLPGKDGHSVCRSVRGAYTGPILMLTAREDDMDHVVGLETGADDYVKKPIKPRVLLARIRALLRRFHDTPADGAVEAHGAPENASPMDALVIDELVINRCSQRVTLAGQPVSLTTNEFFLLWHLASNCNQVLDRETLFKAVRGISYDGLDRSIDVAVSKLRKKLGENSSNPWQIKTVWGQGYLFVKDP